MASGSHSSQGTEVNLLAFFCHGGDTMLLMKAANAYACTRKNHLRGSTARNATLVAVRSHAQYTQ